MAHDDDEIVTSEACALLGLDRSTLVRWVQLGKLTPSRKLPGATGAYLFRRSEVSRLASSDAA